MSASDHLLRAEPLLRLGVFVAVLTALLLLERAAPLLPPPPRRLRTQLSNLALLAFGALALRVLMPWLAVDAARWASREHVGASELLRLAPLTAVTVGVIGLDFAVYLQHRIFHCVGWLWALHAVHHSERHLDATTGLRFHPGELVVSMLWKIAVVAALGIPATGVIVFEVTLNAASLFEHANLRLPGRLDALLRRVLVTPAMHRWHHSTESAESLRNFGFCLAWWDRVLGTYDPRGAFPDKPLIGLPLIAESGATTRQMAHTPIESPGLWRMLLLKT